MSADIELYLHLPFCVRKCAYCDFLSFPGSPETQLAYSDALKAEIRAVSARVGALPVRSVFFGGGTPSLLPGEALASLLSLLKASFDFRADAEITLEANPGTFDAAKAESWLRAGFNRVSLGVQSFDDGLLQRLGRIHDADTAKAQIELLRHVGFRNLNLDLMMGLPGQSLSRWQETLEQALFFEPEHLSCYSLIVEPGTPFEKEAEAGRLTLPDEDTERAMYHDTKERLARAGLIQYEISNFALPGFESKHNLGYWDRVPYLGFGLGAASLFQEERFKNTSSLSRYLDFSAEPDRIREERELLSPKDQMEEFMFLGLRKTAGVSKADFRQRFACTPESVYGDVISKLTKEGLLAEEGERLFLTPLGTDLGNMVFGAFLQDS